MLSPYYPALEHFLSGYMHKEWHLFGSTIEDVVNAYEKDSYGLYMEDLAEEIDALLLATENIDESYSKLYPNSVSPDEWNMTPMQWLRHIQNILKS